MRLGLVLVILVIGTVASSTDDGVKVADAEFLNRQLSILDLFQYAYRQDIHPDGELWTKGRDYSIPDNFPHFKYGEAFWRYYKAGKFLDKHQLFSVQMDTHVHEAILIFDLLAYAKDWDSFILASYFCAQNLNPDLFMYAFSSVCLQTKEKEGYVIPAVYEINPFFFFTADVIQRAQDLKMEHHHQKDGEVGAKYIRSTYESEFDHYRTDSKVSYFTDDIGLNAYYYYYHMDYPFWIGSDNWNLNKDRRGEWYLYQHQQLLARFYMERLSNGLDQVYELDWEDNGGEAYYPHLRYFNGISFPARPYKYSFKTNHDAYHSAITYEDRIHDSIDAGYLFVHGESVPLNETEDVELLGNIMQWNYDAVDRKYYGFWEKYAREALSPVIYLNGERSVIPSVLQHYETSMRDPLFYEFYERFVNLYWRHKDTFDSYTRDELNFPGVSIEKVHINDLITYFEFVNSDITNAVQNGEAEKNNRKDQDIVYYAETERLNHVPFTVTLKINSSAPHKAIVKFFISPKYDENEHEIGCEESRENWFELEHFVVDLVEGVNVVKRTSADFTWFVKDRPTFYEIYKRVMAAKEQSVPYKIDNTDYHHCGFPERLMLPKGTRNGFDVKWFFVVYPFRAPKKAQFTGYDPRVSCGVGTGARQIDALPFGWPFDRKINDDAWPTENMEIVETKIYHKTDAEDIKKLCDTFVPPKKD